MTPIIFSSACTSCTIPIPHACSHMLFVYVSATGMQFASLATQKVVFEWDSQNRPRRKPHVKRHTGTSAHVPVNIKFNLDLGRNDRKSVSLS